MDCCYCARQSLPWCFFHRAGPVFRPNSRDGSTEWHLLPITFLVVLITREPSKVCFAAAVIMIEKWIKIQWRSARNLSWTDGVITAMINRYTGSPPRRLLGAADGTLIELAIFTLSAGRLPQPNPSAQETARGRSLSSFPFNIHTCEPMLYHHYHYLRLKLK